MNMSGLSFNALPPIDLPFRFFLSAPLFIIACALLVLFSGETLWFSRWQPNMLALIHGFTLGFLTMVMMGALLQLLPVIGGIGIGKPRLIATTSHALYSAGVITLMLNFVLTNNWLTLTALVLLSLGLGIYLGAIIWVLIKKMSQGDSINCFRLAIASLTILLLLGILLLANKVGITVPFILYDKHLTDIHALMGLVGWAGILIIAVSFQVLPMFHVAPNMPKYIRQYLGACTFALLIAYIFYTELALGLLVISQGGFALTLLYVINQRKRKVPDTSIKYWKLSASTLLLLNLLYFLPDSFYSSTHSPLFMALPDKTMLLTAIFIYFYLLSVIQGMLLKILPFLSYTHLQQRCLLDFSAMQFIPHMHEFLNKKHGIVLFYIHIISGLSLLAVIIKPSLYLIFALFLLLEFVWLFVLMMRCMALYFRVNKKINLSNTA